MKKASGGFLFKALSIGLNYLFILIVTKFYGVDAWGTMAICLSIINILSIFGRMGVDVAILRFASTFKNNNSVLFRIYFKGFKIIFVFASSATLITFLCSEFIALEIFNKQYLRGYIKISSVGILPYSLLFLNGQYLRAKEKTKEFFLLVDVLKYLIPIILIGLFYYSELFTGKSVAIYSFVGALYISAILSTIKIFVGKGVIFKKKIVSGKKIIETALPLFLGSSALLIMGWVDTLMIGFFKTETDTGIYNILVKIAQVPTIVLIAVNGILATKISYYFNNNQFENFRKVIHQGSKMIFLGSLPIFLFLLLLYPYLIKMFELEDKDVLVVFLILLLGQFMNVISGSVALILQMIGEQKVFSKILTIGLLVNIGLNLFLIPELGLKGAAISTTISLTLWNLVSIVFIYNKTGVLTFYLPNK
ncbi:polysaccharide biosynthesis C-terminal domain-containing protein [Christiangramia echinicola]|uniref:oligosaccharide flippase family protein n=1 Tax=Christiangramia echinicola TaxID=279359 RepID=UPI0012FE456B|nr:polysaccharide biosynthesis C-terminal domain-containing protein [Christiangramia echinicola]